MFIDEFLVVRLERGSGGGQGDLVVTLVPGAPAQALVECCGIAEADDGSLVELEAVAVVGPADQEVPGMVQDLGEVRRFGGALVVGQVEQREQPPAALLDAA